MPTFRSVLGGLLVLFGTGCTRAPELSFNDADDVTKLPKTHQTQIRAVLRDFFGTPVNPRFRVPDEEEDDESEEISFTDLLDHDQVVLGAHVFHRRCAGCHGVTGDGNGEAAPYLQPKPRDYRRGEFKFTSTPYGAKPHRNDLIRVIRYGAKGTSMPAFRFLPDAELEAVVDYVILLSHRGELERQVAMIADIDYDEDEELELIEFTDTLAGIRSAWEEAVAQVTIPVTAQPRYDDDSILLGRKAFLSRGCSKCHGDNARGQTAWLSRKFLDAQAEKPEAEREKINYDAWGEPAPAADLTAGMLHGGRRPIDIYRRIYTGINATPMPAFANALAEEPETIWHLVHYVLSVVEGREVDGIDEVQAEPVEESTQALSPSLKQSLAQD